MQLQKHKEDDGIEFFPPSASEPWRDQKSSKIKSRFGVIPIAFHFHFDKAGAFLLSEWPVCDAFVDHGAVDIHVRWRTHEDVRSDPYNLPLFKTIKMPWFVMLCIGDDGSFTDTVDLNAIFILPLKALAPALSGLLGHVSSVEVNIPVSGIRFERPINDPIVYWDEKQHVFDFYVYGDVEETCQYAMLPIRFPSVLEADGYSYTRIVVKISPKPARGTLAMYEFLETPELENLAIRIELSQLANANGFGVRVIETNSRTRTKVQVDLRGLDAFLSRPRKRKRQQPGRAAKNIYTVA